MAQSMHCEEKLSCRVMARTLSTDICILPTRRAGFSSTRECTLNRAAMLVFFMVKNLYYALYAR
jgi:hypothetical protein